MKDIYFKEYYQRCMRSRGIIVFGFLAAAAVVLFVFLRDRHMAWKFSYLMDAAGYALRTGHFDVLDLIDTSIWIALGIVLACIIGAGWHVIQMFNGSYLKYVHNYCAAQGDADHEMQRLIEFYESNLPMTGHTKDIRLDNRYYMYSIGTKIWVESTSNLIWAYQNVTQHRVNFIPTHKTYTLVMWDKSKKSHPIEMRQASVLSCLDYLNQICPHIILGYSKELELLYFKQREQFIELSHKKALEKKGQLS